jgi:hypothetical protein
MPHRGKNNDVDKKLWGREKSWLSSLGWNDIDQKLYVHNHLNVESGMKLHWEGLSFIFTHSSTHMGHLDENFNKKNMSV